MDIDTTLDFLKSYRFSPFKVKNDGTFFIPQKYLDVLLTLESVELDFTKLEATQTNWRLIRELLVSGYWMDCWYNKNDNIPTPKSEIISLKNDVTWNTPKFIRLNSLSSKNQTTPLYGLNEETRKNILNTERCVESISLAKRINREISFVVRDWVDLSHGTEWRCFIFEDELKGISLNDYSNSEMNKDEIVLRAKNLLKKVKYNLPCVDCVMDIWLHNTLPKNDLLIEFNSYGFWGNAGSGLFDWVEDGALLYNPEKCEIEIRI